MPPTFEFIPAPLSISRHVLVIVFLYAAINKASMLKLSLLLLYRQAYSAFHPSGVSKWVVIRITGMLTIRRKPGAAYGCLIAGQSPCARALTAAYRLYACSVYDTKTPLQYAVCGAACSPFGCSWWFGRTQNKATTRNRAFCVEQSPTAHSFHTKNYQRSKTCSRHIFSHVPTALANCFQSTSSEHCTAPL